MADSSTRSMTIAAPAHDIMAVIADFPAYPQWADAVKDVDVLDPGNGRRALRVRFRIDAGLLRDTYELAYRWAADDLSVTWELVSGHLQKAQHGSYVLRPLDGADADGARTEVTYTLAVDLTVPLVGVLRRKAERVIMDTALTELSRRVQGGS